MTLNPARPITELTGENWGITRQIVSRQHCLARVRAIAKAARPQNIRKAPPALRRGWAKCVLETIAEHRELYLGAIWHTSGAEVRWNS